MKINTLKAILLSSGMTLLVVDVPAVQAACTGGFINEQLPETTPTAEFTDNGDGTVIHDRTGLTWKRCSEGQTWNGETSACDGTATAMAWADALTAARDATDGGYNDWRLPNIKELKSIIEYCAGHPAINKTIFSISNGGQYNGWYFWTASTPVGSPDNAYLVDFMDGYLVYDPKTSGDFYARLVRGGNWPDRFDSQLDWSPESFAFTAVTDAALNTQYTSNAVTLAGLNAVTGIGVSGGEYAAGSACGGVGGSEIAWTSAPGSVVNGDTVCVRQTSSPNNSVTTVATLNVGGVTADFSVTTVRAPAADLAVSMAASPNPARSGEGVNFVVTVSNSGPDGATNVQVALTPPSGATFVASSGCGEDPIGTTLCTLGGLASGGTDSFTLSYDVVYTPVASLTLGATVSSDLSDQNPGDNTATLVTTVIDYDSDGDGLSNWSEQAAGSDPTNPDTDSDGIPDGADPNPVVAEANSCARVTMPLTGIVWQSDHTYSCTKSLIQTGSNVTAKPRSKVGLLGYQIILGPGFHAQPGSSVWVTTP